MSVLSVVSSLSCVVPCGPVSQSSWCFLPHVTSYVVVCGPSFLCHCVRAGGGVLLGMACSTVMLPCGDSLSPLSNYKWRLTWQQIKYNINAEVCGNVYLNIRRGSLDIGLGHREEGKRCGENKPALTLNSF